MYNWTITMPHEPEKCWTLLSCVEVDRQMKTQTIAYKLYAIMHFDEQLYGMIYKTQHNQWCNARVDSIRYKPISHSNWKLANRLTKYNQPIYMEKRDCTGYVLCISILNNYWKTFSLTSLNHRCVFKIDVYFACWNDIIIIITTFIDYMREF